MKIQQTFNNINFGLKISEPAAANLINVYKAWGVEPQNIAKEIKSIKDSQPDNVEILTFNSNMHNYLNSRAGAKFDIKSDMWLKYNNNVCCVDVENLFPYKNNGGKYSKKETTEHITNHMLNSVQDAVNSIKEDNFDSSAYDELTEIMHMADCDD